MLKPDLLAGGADADLLAAYEEYRACEVAFLTDPTASSQPEAQRDAHCSRMLALRDWAGSIRARTPAGLAVLALIAMRETDLLGDDTVKAWDGYSKPEGADEEPALRVLWNLVESARAMMAPPPADDAELLAAEAEYRRLWTLINTWPGEDDPPQKVTDQFWHQVEQVATLPASTTEGVAAKLRTFAYEIDGCDYHRTEIFPQFIRTALEGAERASLTAAARKPQNEERAA